MPAHAFGEAAAREAAGHWGFGSDVDLQLLCISENATYQLTEPATGVSSVLRLNRPGYHSRAEIESELAWTIALRRDGVVRTPAALPGAGGELVATIAPGRHAVRFGFAEGVEPDVGSIAASMPALGQLTARLHEHARHWTRPATFTRFSWDLSSGLGDGVTAGRWGDWRAALPPGARAERALLEKAAGTVASALTDYGYDPSRYGLIHADLRASNLLVTSADQVTVIDFDDCGMSWYCYDLAASLSFIEHVPELGELAAGWLAGYRTAGCFTGADLEAVPSLVMLRRLQLLAWTASHRETEMARSVGPDFAAQTAEVATAYLSGRLLAGLG